MNGDLLIFGPVTLNHEKYVEPPKADSELVPFHHFLIENEKGEVVGHINFRIGNTSHVQNCAGHLGYAINEAFRGKHYSLYACLAIKPFIQDFYSSILITAEVDNAPSINIIEKLGAEYLDQVVVPKTDPGYVHGARQKVRYKWAVV